jgi:Fe-S-cluster-containing dehydrogenase component
LHRALAGQREALAAGNGESFVVLAGASSSPTLARQLEDLRKKYPAARCVHWEPIGREQAVEGGILAYGRPVSPMFNLAKADVILAIDSDLLSDAPGNLVYARDFAARRNPAQGAAMNRLYAIETIPTLTGAQADHRFVATPREAPRLIEALASVIFGQPGPDAPPWLGAIVADLKAHHGRALIHIGPDHARETHALVFAMNEALGARGATLDLIQPVLHPSSDAAFTLSALVNEMNAGKISSLLILDANPVFAAPGRLGFADALKRVPFTLTLSATETETTDASLWAVPMTHPWEGWSDACAFNGAASILQPQALPLYGGVEPSAFLSLLMRPDAPETLDTVRDTWRPHLAASFDDAWRDALATGVISNTESAPINAALRPEARGLRPPEIESPSPTLLFRPDPYIWDGRYADNAWLQELPRPLTKMTWDNPLLISPAYATRMGVTDGDLVQISVEDRRAEAPVCVLPGQADDCIVAVLGFGRRHAGEVGRGVGVDFFPLLGGGGVTELRKLGPREALARTEHHHAMQDTQGRYARRATLAEFVAGEIRREATEGPSLYRWKPQGPAEWGMSVDLNACIGCSACVVACQAENNIPTVGKEEVLRQREMHWLRIDRYYEGAPENPAINFQPILCMHCEQAPCEPVCPVGATMHDSEGLNVMVYNRCIGTRFCSNNCPYRVRRFNYSAFADKEARPIESRNPDVTVRARGVMEKCTFCIQRIAQARIDADRENAPLAEIETSCQAACPTRAFTFGNLAKADSDVVRRKQSPRAYALLAEENTIPRVTYETRIVNRNPAIGGGE